MPTILIGSSSFQYQPDGDNVKMGPDGSGQATLTYKVPTGFNFNNIPKPLAPHPAYPSLLLYEAETNREPGEVFAVTCTYRGIVADNPVVYMQQSFDGTLSSEPIATHPKFAHPVSSPPVLPAEVVAIENALANHQLYTIDFPDATAEGVKLFTYMLRKQDSYFCVRSNYTQSYTSRNIPSDYSALGKISNPPGAPNLPDSENWLFSGLSWTKAGGVVIVKREYMASGRLGWDSYLY